MCVNVRVCVCACVYDDLLFSFNVCFIVKADRVTHLEQIIPFFYMEELH